MTTQLDPDATKERALQRMKLLATAMLGLVAVVFVIARLADDGQTWIGYLVAAAEAAMVGALADWFAVTALFRHPLGLPIPHTAIIPKRKDQIGVSLGEFVESNFLSRELVDERLAHAHVARRLGTWLADDANARRAGSAVADVVRGGLDVLDDEAISASIERLAERRLRSLPTTALVARAIDIGVEGMHHEPLLDAVLRGLQTFLDDHRDELRAQLDRESPWWVPEPVDNRIFAKIFDGANHFLGDLLADHDHPIRRGIEDRLVTLAARLRDDPELIARGEQLKEEALAHPEVRAWIGSLWGDAKGALHRATTEPDGELRRRVDESLASLGRRMLDDAEMQDKVDRWISSAAGYLVEHYRGEAANLIASTVSRWDADATGRRLELQVGRDLQFIRINGTVVGGLAGVVIHAIDRLVL